MFKPAHVLQVALVAIVLAGCASSPKTPVTALPADTQAQSAAASAPAENGAATGKGSPSQRNGRASVAAARSAQGQEGFLAPNGTLLPDVQVYAAQVAQTRNIPLAQVQSLLKEARYNATVVRLMTPSPTRIRRSWFTYRNRFIEPVRIKAGVQFWQEHRAKLDSVAKQYGVPPSIIVAIIGVETIYGRHMGNFRILDALATLGFRHPDTARPERSQLFRDQLADLIQLDARRELDARTETGSFAGAMGLPQFMPGSILRYAVDGDKDGHIDLRTSPDDAIASVASFLRQHGWQPGLPVFAPVALPGDAAKLVKGGLEPTYTWEQLRQLGARERQSPPPYAWREHLLGIVDLLDEPRGTAEYRTGTPNFFAITHYNRSYFYAASVADLAQELANRVGYGAPN
ncbi:lytic murein transglycosylase B [Eoetvoesiella caeni]